MGAKIFVLAGAVVTGIVLADILIHPQGTTAAGNAIVGVEKPAANALLGVPS
jgi:hypothetical protein